MRKIEILALILVLTAGAASAAVSIKVTAGMTYFSGNDYNKGIQGIYDYCNDNFNDVVGKYNPLHMGMGLGGEIVVSLDPHFGLGLGAGFFRSSRQNELSLEWMNISVKQTYKPSLRVIPLVLNLHYDVPLQRALRLDVFAGAGYYMTHFDHDSNLETDFFSYEQSQEFRSKANTFGLQGGIGLELHLNSHFAFVVQAEGRYARITSLKGDLVEDESWFLGKSHNEERDAYLWYLERNASGHIYSQVLFAKNQPASAEVTNVRKGELNLSGVTGTAGLKIMF
jgi:opacity protein-like surface antigen